MLTKYVIIATGLLVAASWIMELLKTIGWSG